MFFDRLSTRYERLRADAVVWREIEAERAAEDGVLSDRSLR